MAEPTEADYWKAARLCTEDRAVRSEAIAQALAAARADGAAARDKEWAAAFHRGDWFEDEPDMTLEAFQKHGDNRRGTFNEIARVCHEQGVKEGLTKAYDVAKREEKSAMSGRGEYYQGREHAAEAIADGIDELRKP